MDDRKLPPSAERMREYTGDELRDVAIAFIAIETVAVALRFLSLKLSEKRFGIDDLLTIPGYLCCMSLNILAVVSTQITPIGYHLNVIQATGPHALITLSKCLYATPIIYFSACCFPRIILLTLYLRIVQSQRPYRLVCFALMGFIIVYTIVDTFIAAFECWPVASFWNPGVTDGRCINIPQFYRWGTVPNILIDLMMLLLPLPVVWSLHVPGPVKVGLAVTFLTGSMGMVTSICRCVAFFINDPLVDQAVIFMQWSIIEPGTYLVAACLPCYRPLVKLVVNRGRKSQRHNYGPV